MTCHSMTESFSNNIALSLAVQNVGPRLSSAVTCLALVLFFVLRVWLEPYSLATDQSLFRYGSRAQRPRKQSWEG